MSASASCPSPSAFFRHPTTLSANVSASSGFAPIAWKRPANNFLGAALRSIRAPSAMKETLILDRPKRKANPPCAGREDSGAAVSCAPPEVCGAVIDCAEPEDCGPAVGCAEPEG